MKSPPCTHLPYMLCIYCYSRVKMVLHSSGPIVTCIVLEGFRLLYSAANTLLQKTHLATKIARQPLQAKYNVADTNRKQAEIHANCTSAWHPVTQLHLTNKAIIELYWHEQQSNATMECTHMAFAAAVHVQLKAKIMDDMRPTCNCSVIGICA